MQLPQVYYKHALKTVQYLRWRVPLPRQHLSRQHNIYFRYSGIAWVIASDCHDATKSDHFQEISFSLYKKMDLS